MGSFKVTGLDQLQRQLNKLAKNAHDLDGKHQVPFSVLFNPAFLAAHSSFGSFDELLIAGGFEVNSEEDFEAIPDDVFDAHIASVTDFAGWEQMLSAATEEYVSRELFDGL